MIGIVYCATNLANGKRYVGITTAGIKKRWAMHVWLAMTNRDGCPVLCKAIRKNGAGVFLVEQIGSAATIDELRTKEIEWIAKLGTKVPNGYNVCSGGVGAMGREQSEYTRAIIGAKARARMAAPGSKELRSEKMKRYYADHPEKLAELAKLAKASALALDPSRMWDAETKAKRAATVSDPEWKRRHSESTRAARLATSAQRLAAGVPIYNKTENYRPATAGVKYSENRRAEISARQTGKKRGPYKTHHETGVLL